jgi:hypothetical protein
MVEGVAQLVNSFRPERVSDFRPVKGDARHAVGLVVRDILVRFNLCPVCHVDLKPPVSESTVNSSQ